MSTIQVIAKTTLKEFFAKKLIYFLLFLVLFVTISSGAEFYSIFQNAGDDPQALLSRKAAALGQMLSVWSTLSILIAVIYAAGLIRNEKKSKSILALLSKPVARWQLLLGKWLGLQYFFMSLLFVGFLVCWVFMLYWEISFTYLFWTGISNYIVGMLLYPGLSFIFSLFIPAVIGGGLAFIIWQFSAAFKLAMQSSIDWLKPIGTVLYYIAPATISESLVERGILNNLLEPEFGLYWSIIVENFLYIAVVFFIGALLFKRKDIVLG